MVLADEPAVGVDEGLGNSGCDEAALLIAGGQALEKDRPLGDNPAVRKARDLDKLLATVIPGLSAMLELAVRGDIRGPDERQDEVARSAPPGVANGLEVREFCKPAAFISVGNEVPNTSDVAVVLQPEVVRFCQAEQVGIRYRARNRPRAPRIRQ